MRRIALGFLAMIFITTISGCSRGARKDATGVYTGTIQAVSPDEIKMVEGLIFKVSSRAKLCSQTGQATTKESLTVGTEVGIVFKQDRDGSLECLAIQVGVAKLDGRVNVRDGVIVVDVVCCGDTYLGAGGTRE